ncbi:MAG: amidohydrolase [Rhodothermales bacterium]|jgi:amidohydrolase
MIKDLRKRITARLPALREFRHVLHRNPEIGLKEYETRARIAAALADSALPIRDPLMETDLIGELPGASDQLICLRADIDALPICEPRNQPWSSQNKGFMHACGHDGHTTMLVGAAQVLCELRNELPHSVRFVFQPGEEMVCGGKTLVARGACDGATAAYALHGWPGLPAGTIACKPGPLMAAGAAFHITLRGIGCHGAMPEKGRNPIPAGAEIVTALQALHDAEFARSGTLVSVCSVRAGRNSTVIPDSLVIEGTTRYHVAEFATRMPTQIRGVAESAAARHGLECEITFLAEYDTPVVNSTAGYQAVREAAVVAGSFQEAKPSLAMEDFAFYLPGREGAMFWLGLGEDYPSLHSPKFDFNDEVLATGILMFCLLALHGEAAQ